MLGNVQVPGPLQRGCAVLSDGFAPGILSAGVSAAVALVVAVAVVVVVVSHGGLQVEAKAGEELVPDQLTVADSGRCRVVRWGLSVRQGCQMNWLR